MSAPSVPVIPPRPSRSPHVHGLDVPSIPARPTNRRLDRSVSPMRDSYAPSPLNNLPNGGDITRITSNDPPQRPPSVTIPSLGEEGIEYADLPVDISSETVLPTETRNVGSDLKLHAPKPSLPLSSAKAQVQAVTRTDSREASAAGFGKSPSPDNDESERRPRSSISKPSASRADSSTASSNRRASVQLDEEHGIPEIGQRVPMYRNAGDVQAPSPAPGTPASSGGLRAGRHHQRTRSGRDVLLPPGSYGLHGHGVHAADKFEKAWYDKHPDEFVREEKGQYGPAIAPRPDWALSSDDLNRIVRSSAENGSGLGTSPAVVGTPVEEVGYIASDEYSRLATPPLGGGPRQDTQPSVESPLRQSSFPLGLQRTRSAQSNASSDAGSRTIHVDDPHHHEGSAEYSPHDEEEEVDQEDEPILAADEVRPDSALLHPAISPRRSSNDFHDLERFRSRTPSAPNSRPSSIHGAPAGLARWNSRGDEREDNHTPLEDVEEYEPLFPDDERGTSVPTAERFKKRQELLKHRFPSQDIWEDTPDSLQLLASVSTPELPKDESVNKFETPEAEETRKKHTEQIDAHDVASHILESRSDQKPPTRPDVLRQQRFPSRDIWEDAPESHQLVTTIEPTDAKVKSPTDTAKPSVPARPIIPAKPQKPANLPIPARPSKPISRDAPDSAAAPPVTKSKPAVPARPAAGKIAGLKANFLSDLNSRLQLGPQGPKATEKQEEEAPAEKTPLSDARKSRARGPARRKPAVITESKLPSIPEIRIMDAWNVWEVGMDGNLTITRPEKTAVTVEEKPVAADVDEESENNTMAPPIAKNVTGESPDPEPTSEHIEHPEPHLENSTEQQEPAASTDSATDAVGPSPKSSPSEPVPAEPDASVEPTAMSNEHNDSPISSHKTISEDALEHMAASADGKRESDGSVNDQA